MKNFFLAFLVCVDRETHAVYLFLINDILALVCSFACLHNIRN